MARDLADIGSRRAARALRTMLDEPIAKQAAGRPVPGPSWCAAGAIAWSRDAWARRVTDMLPRGQQAIVPGYAHMAHYSGALKVSEILREFLADSGTRRT